MPKKHARPQPLVTEVVATDGWKVGHTSGGRVAVLFHVPGEGWTAAYELSPRAAGDIAGGLRDTVGLLARRN